MYYCKKIIKVVTVIKSFKMNHKTQHHFTRLFTLLKTRCKIVILLLVLVLSSGTRLFAGNPPDEGMWLPILVERLNYVDM